MEDSIRVLATNLESLPGRSGLASGEKTRGLAIQAEEVFQKTPRKISLFRGNRMAFPDGSFPAVHAEEDNDEEEDINGERERPSPEV